MPKGGINALDAMTLFFQGINAWRQYIDDSARVHGVIIDGGLVPHIQHIDIGLLRLFQ